MATVSLPSLNHPHSEMSSLISPGECSRLDVSLSSRVHVNHPRMRFQPRSSMSVQEKLGQSHAKIPADIAEIQPIDQHFVHLQRHCCDASVLKAVRELGYLRDQPAFEKDSYLGTNLIYLLTSTGSLTEASRVFRRLHEPSASAWGAIIVAHVNLGENIKAYELYKQMRNFDIHLDSHGFVAILNSSMTFAATFEIHTHVIEAGLELDMYVGSSLIQVYMKFGCFDDACTVFSKFGRTNIVMWNTLITGYAHHGNVKDAHILFKKMKEEKLNPNHITYVSLLKSCANISDIKQGKHIHAEIVGCNFEIIDYVGNTLVYMYAKCGDLAEAQIMFNRLLKQDIVAWNVILSAYVQRGDFNEALQGFRNMGVHNVEPDRVTYTAVLSACSSLGSLEWGRKIHSEIINRGLICDLFIGSSLVDMYARCGSIDDATVTFLTLSKRNVVTWSALLAGHVQEAANEVAFSLLEAMEKEGIKPNEVILSCILRACIGPSALEKGREIHTKVIECGFESDLFLGNCLIDMYMNCESLCDASSIFDRMPERDLVSWTSLITGYTQHGHCLEALHSFEKMQQTGMRTNEITFIPVLKACANLLDLDRGKTIHAYLIERGFHLDVNCGTVLVDMYAICGMLETTLIEFNKLPLRDVQAWTTLISGYTRHECGVEALQTFKLMKQQNIEPNEVTLISVLKACSSISALEHGRQAHSQLIELGFAVDAVTGNALIDMYAKCGNLEDAYRVLQGSANRDIVGWSSLMQGYALQCNYQQTFQCYEYLLGSGLKPDYVTFICLLSACAHPGLLDEGCFFFNSMMEQYGITPLVEHYNALADVLGQVGKLAEAEDLLDTLSSPSNVVGWTSLLCSSKKHGNVTLGKRCFDLLIKLEPEDAAGYTALMSSVYIQAGLYEDAKRLKEAGKKARKWKKPAKSCIEVGTQVHSFTVGDKAHPQHEQIYARLAGLMKKIGKLGYQPLPLHSKENQDLLCGHSEKLAVAFGLLSTPEGSTIRVTKNLRMCSDCHTAIRIASKAELREIVVIDAFCIHRFDNGDCCCKEM